jgi:hypothetical protein
MTPDVLFNKRVPTETKTLALRRALGYSLLMWNFEFEERGSPDFSSRAGAPYGTA